MSTKIFDVFKVKKEFNNYEFLNFKIIEQGNIIKKELVKRYNKQMVKKFLEYIDDQTINNILIEKNFYDVCD